MPQETKSTDCSRLAVLLAKLARSTGKSLGTTDYATIQAAMVKELPTLKPHEITASLASYSRFAKEKARAAAPQVIQQLQQKVETVKGKKGAARPAKNIKAALKVVQGAVNSGNPEAAAGAIKKIKTEADYLERMGKRVKEKGEQADLGRDLNAMARQIIEANPGLGRKALVDQLHEKVKTVAPDMTRSQVRDALSGYGEFTPQRKDAVSVELAGIQGELLEEGKLEDIRRGEAAKKTGREPRPTTDERRELIKQVNDEKKTLVNAGNDPNRLKSALESAKTRMRNQIKDMTRQIQAKMRDARKAGKVQEDAELVSLRAQRDKVKTEFDQVFGIEAAGDAKRREARIKQLDAQIAQLKEGKPLEKRERPAVDPEIQKRIDEKNELAKRLGEPEKIAARIAELKTRLEAAKQGQAREKKPKAAKHSEIVKLEKELRATEAREARIKKNLSDIKAMYEGADMSRVAKEPEQGPKTREEAVEEATRLWSEGMKRAQTEESEIRRLVDQLESGIIQTKSKRLKELTDAEWVRQDKLKRLRREANLRIKEIGLSNAGKVWKKIKLGLGLWRGALVMGDLGSIGIQLGSYTTSLPNIVKGRSAKTIWTGLRSLLDPKVAQRVQMQVERMAPVYQRRMGIDFTDYGGGFTKSEEIFNNEVSRHFERIPGLGRGYRATERAVVTMMNHARMTMADVMAQGLFENGNATDAELKAIGRMVNVSTGRVKFTGATEVAAKQAAELLFAPKMYAANLFWSMGQPLLAAPTFRAGRIIAANYAGQLAGIAALVALWRMFNGDDSVELDPRSTWFLRLKRDNHYIDIPGWKASTISLIAKTISGQEKKATGEITPLRYPIYFGRPDANDKEAVKAATPKYGERQMRDIWTDFLMNRMAPGPGTVSAILQNKDFKGDRWTPWSMLPINIGARQAYQVLKDGAEQGQLPQSLAEAALVLFGANVTVLDPEIVRITNEIRSETSPGRLKVLDKQLSARRKEIREELEGR